MKPPGRRLIAALSLPLLALLCALALGAAWALIEPWLRHALWPAFVIAVVLAGVLYSCSHRPGWGTALLAALATLVAAGYAECLELALRIARQLGLSLLTVIQTSGFGDLGQMAWLLLPTERLAVYAAAAVLAAAVSRVLSAWKRRSHET